MCSEPWEVRLDHDERRVRERHFIEQMGLLYSEMGGVPMMGRLLGHLLICDPPVQSSSELAEALDASKGSISTATRQLVHLGLVEKVPVPGSRAHHFRLRDNAWAHQMKQDATRLQLKLRVVEEGEDLVGDDPDRAGRLRDFRDFCTYLSRELPALIDRWLAEKEDA